MDRTPLKCSCGAVNGYANNVSPSSGNRVICYCDDCQAFANYLNCADPILDEHGGTDIFQLPPANIEICQGLDQVRCVRLADKGLYRWYTACCETPIGNTVGAGLPFVGVVHNFMECEGNRDHVLGPVLAKVQAQHASKSLPSKGVSKGFPLSITLRIISKIIIWKLGGKGSPNPFFTNGGSPISEPKVLNIAIS